MSKQETRRRTTADLIEKRRPRAGQSENGAKRAGAGQARPKSQRRSKDGRSDSAGAQRGQLKVEQVAVSRLHPWPENPRVMPAAEMASLERSIAHYGMVQPLVVRRADDVVLAGHQRLEAGRAIGLASVPVVYVDLCEAEAKALNLALNRIEGEWDLPRLGALLEELQDLKGFDQTLSGFDNPEIDDLLAALERDSAPDPREESFPEAAEALQQWREQAPTRVSSGELWSLGRHRLLCGDSLAAGALKAVCDDQPVDLVLTDPPYGIDYQSALPARGRRKQAIANDAAAGFEGFLARSLPAIKAVMKRGGVVYWFAGGGGPSAVLARVLLAFEEHFQLLNTLVWDKMDPGLGWRWRRSWEAIIEAAHGRPKAWHGGTDKRNVLRYPHAMPGADDHPTPKPVPLLEELIQASAPARGTVLDPFAGSGSTLVAAERTGRSCRAVELDPRYCDITLARWEAVSGQEARQA